MAMAIRAVLWDIDDTIFDYATADRTGMRLHLGQEGLPDGCTTVEQALLRWAELTEVHWARFAAGSATSRASAAAGCGTSPDCR